MIMTVDCSDVCLYCDSVVIAVVEKILFSMRCESAIR